MNTLWIVVISVLTIYLVYNFYAKRIDRNVIQPDAKRATPARTADRVRVCSSKRSSPPRSPCRWPNC